MCAGSPKCGDEGPKARNLLLHRQDDVEQHNRCDLQDHARDQRADQLRRILRLTRGGAVRLVDRLVERNLVDKQPSAIDRRVMTLALTPSGLQLRDKLLALRRDALERFPLTRNRTGPLPHPATQRQYAGMGGRVGERAGPV